MTKLIVSSSKENKCDESDNKFKVIIDIYGLEMNEVGNPCSCAITGNVLNTKHVPISGRPLVKYTCADPEKSVRVGPESILKALKYFTAGRTGLPREAIGPSGPIASQGGSVP